LLLSRLQETVFRPQKFDAQTLQAIGIGHTSELLPSLTL
jgi:hypothetical protein